jgi:hypothetical protein
MTPNFDALSRTKGGQFYSVLEHQSKLDGAVKDRLLHATTAAIPRKIDAEAHRLDSVTALVAAKLLAPHGIPSDLASEALGVLVARIKARQSGTSSGGAKVKHIVSMGKNGGTILQLVSVRDSWALQVVGEQVGSWFSLDNKGKPINTGNLDHRAEEARKLAKGIDAAQKQAAKRIGNPAQSISSIVALLNKCLPPMPKSIDYRTLTLMGPGAINCAGIGINGERFTDFLSVVAHFRPDLVKLLAKA